ncbi:hypothetical protein [uncultured Winogradskyella sp.]|uniref:hypothetical protein n=1 Tax=uncultured Winogradskyella sp. TaxID=395353 RepID=UPI003514535D
MSILKNPIFISLFSLAVLVHLTKLFGFSLPNSLAFYLNDLLCMPIVLSLCLAAVRWLKKDGHIYIPWVAIILITLYYSFHFEWLLPKFMSRYTADLIDVGLYFVGALLFYVFQKRLF